MAINISNGVKPFVDLCVQTIVGATAFVVVLVVACLLSYFMKLIAPVAPKWAFESGELIEKGLYALDIISFGLFLLGEFIKFIKALWKEVSKGNGQ